MTSRWYTEEQEPANEWHENNYNNHEQVRGNIDDNELKRKHKRDDAKLEQGNDTEADVRTADKRVVFTLKGVRPMGASNMPSGMQQDGATNRSR